MNAPAWWGEAEPDVHRAVEEFSDRVKKKIERYPLPRMIASKNPFLFRARVTGDAGMLARMIVDAFLSSSEETMFGNILEEIAIAICSHAKGGWKSYASNIDLEFEEGRERVLIQIKSGPNWGNKSQRDKLVQDFRAASTVARQGQFTGVRCVEGVCYGPSERKDLGSHWKLVGKPFWFAISGWDGTADAVMGVIGKHAGNGLQDVREQAYQRVVSCLTESQVVMPDGSIVWDQLLDMVLAPRS